MTIIVNVDAVAKNRKFKSFKTTGSAWSRACLTRSRWRSMRLTQFTTSLAKGIFHQVDPEAFPTLFVISLKTKMAFATS